MNGVENYDCKPPGHKKKDCIRLNKRPYKSGNLENSRKEQRRYHRSKHSFEPGLLSEQLETNSENFGNKEKKWSHYNNIASRSNDEHYHQRGSKFGSSSPVGKIVGHKKPSLLIITLLAAMQSFAVTVKGKLTLMKVTTSPTPQHLGSDLLSRCVICRYRNKQMVLAFWWIQGCFVG